MARLVVDELSEKQAERIVLLDISDVSRIDDYFVIASTMSKRQFDAVEDAKLVEKGGLRALLLEIRRGSSLSSLIQDFLSEPPKIIALKVAEAAGKAIKGSALEIVIIGSLEIMKVVTDTSEWEESVGNFVSGAVRAVVATAIAAAVVVGFGVVGW